MTSTARLDQAVADYMEQAKVDEDVASDGPVIAWCMVVATLNPEDPEAPAVWVVDPNGTPSFITSGLLAEAVASRTMTER